jgi:hypothetical protein
MRSGTILQGRTPSLEITHHNIITIYFLNQLWMMPTELRTSSIGFNSTLYILLNYL